MKKNNKKKNILLVLYFWVNLASWIWSDSTICVLATQQQLRVSTLCVCVCVWTYRFPFSLQVISV